ncbi:MAG TPA: cytochrome C [Gammaproteobacteria bacterium]|nr:cytochrome C [Gammaproteobacteria bacterium]
MRVERQVIAMLALVLGTVASAPVAAGDAQDPAVERGRYLARIAGCNDCHTTGYPQSGGRVPESEWLKGDRLGWRGPWGTTYAGNLRLLADGITQEQWLNLARNARYRPPMPWFALRDMSEEDLVAIYRLLRHLGPAGEPGPAWVPPDQDPQGPFVQFPAAPE